MLSLGAAFVYTTESNNTVIGEKSYNIIYTIS